MHLSSLARTLRLSAHPAYRPDIDGLRALAVLPVLLFHAHIAGFSGGFVGVDIFFVISGYLITGIITREIDEGTFSIVNFYERRARRILPALFVVVTAVLAGASWLYLPGDFEDVPRSALMALLFLANVWFFLNTGYFAGGSETMPLLHTWSLGVEEQFYIGFPILLWLVARFRPSWRLGVVAAVAAFSFAIALATQNKGDGFAFYLLPARAWELFAGSLLALGAVPSVRNRMAREVISLAALAAIAASVTLYNSQTVFPGLAALPPVLGAAALIHCAPGTLTGRLLSLRVPVMIGLISYSLYLWHWPLIVLAEYAQDERLSTVQGLVVIAVSLLLAWASWRFVEQPFRNRKRFGRARIFTLSATGIGALGALSLVMMAQGGWPDRFPKRTVEFAAAKQDFSPRRDACLSPDVGHIPAACNLGADSAPDSVVWGDSHGVELAWVLAEKLKQDGRALAQRTRGSCPPVLGFTRVQDPDCARFNQSVIDEIEGNPALKRIYLAAYWESGNYSAPETLAQFEETLTRLRRAGREVVVIGAVPGQPFNVPRRLAQASALGMDGEVQPTSAQGYLARNQWLRSRYDTWRAQGIRIIDPADTLVDADKTRIVASGHPLYFDSHHLSLAGARVVLEAE